MLLGNKKSWIYKKNRIQKKICFWMMIILMKKKKENCGRLENSKDLKGIGLKGLNLKESRLKLKEEDN